MIQKVEGGSGNFAGNISVTFFLWQGVQRGWKSWKSWKKGGFSKKGWKSWKKYANSTAQAGKAGKFFLP